jgi:hypothetical protein
MVFVFGVDIPLVELIFVLTLTLLGLLGLLIYIVIKQNKINKRLKLIIDKENIELKGLKNIGEEEKDELRLLRFIRTELDKLIYGEAYGRMLSKLMKAKGKKIMTLKEKEKLKRLANQFWKQVQEISEKRKTQGKKQVIFAETSKIVLRPKTVRIEQKAKKAAKPKKRRKPKKRQAPKRKPKTRRRPKPQKRRPAVKRRTARKPKPSKPKKAKGKIKLEGILYEK